MKNLTLLAAMAVCGISAANAQYMVDPSLDNTIDNGNTFDVLMLDVASVERLRDAGKTVNEYAIDDVTRHFYIWDATFVAGTPVGPGVDMQMDGYSCITVTNVGWSGAGFAIDDTAPINLRHFTDDTRFHIALKSSNPASSICLTIGEGHIVSGAEGTADDVAWTPAHISVGTTEFNDNGALYPLVGDIDREGGDWLAVDVSLADLKRLCPDFSYAAGDFYGNIFSVLGGAVTGTEICIDACYFYTNVTGAVEGIEADENDINVVVTDNTINVLGNENNGFELYSVSGQLVRTSDTSVMGVEGLASGIYVVKAGNVAKKVVVR